jgi:hypothetical protein
MESTSTTSSNDLSIADMKNALLNTKVTNENVALNVMVSFLNLAQRRGSFSIDESAKIWECISIFQRNSQGQQSQLQQQQQG